MNQLASEPMLAARQIHRVLLQLMVYLNRGLNSCDAWREFSKEPSFPQFKALITLHQVGPCTLKAIADALGISPASACEMIDRLVELGLVDRRPDAHDRRRVQVSLTPKAVEAVQKHEKLILERMTDLMEILGSDVTQQWVTVAERLNEVFKENLTGCAGSAPAHADQIASGGSVGIGSGAS